MSPANGLETLDFGFGLFDGNGASNFASAGDYTSNTATNTAAAANNVDLFNLSNFFDSNNSGGAQAAVATNSAANNNWQQQKKALLDSQQQQQQQQQQLLEQNSLNALLSQHNAAAAAQQQQQSNNLMSLQQSANMFADLDNMNNQLQQQQQFTNQQQQTHQLNMNHQNNAAANAQNNMQMFVATFVDPNQEDAQPQQMLFLPGSNQVIPMPAGHNMNQHQLQQAQNGQQQPSSGLMAQLANLPVVFPNQASAQQQQTHVQQSQQQQLHQQSQQTSSADNWPAALQQLNASSLEPTPLDLSGFASNVAEQQSFLQQRMVVKQEPAAVPQPTPEEAKAAMPVRPLSAYNFFFSDERERILLNKTDEGDVFDNDKKQRLLLAHLAKDRTKRRPHRKTHGKINFTTLSKLIGQRWKQLSEERKNFYREVAAIDLERYQRELRERSPPTVADM